MSTDQQAAAAGGSGALLHVDDDSAPLLPFDPSAPRLFSWRLRVVVALAALFVAGNLLFLQREVFTGLVDHSHSGDNGGMKQYIVSYWNANATPKTQQPPAATPDPATPDPADIKTEFALNLWSVIEQQHSEQSQHEQRGIVLPLFNRIAALGISLLLEIRALGVDLPVEIPHCGDLRPKFQAELLKRDPLVRIYDVCALAAQAKSEDDGTPLFCRNEAHCHELFRGFDIKILAVVLSQFQEVMLMDADTLYFQSPMPLWTSAKYQQTGTFFFHDRVASENQYLAELKRNSSPKQTHLEFYLSMFDVTPYRSLGVIPRVVATTGAAPILRRRPTVVPLDFVPSDFLLTSHSWNRRSGHQMDSSLLLWNKVRQPRATAILASFVSLNGWDRPPSYGDKELFFLACELAETEYAFSDLSVGAISAERREYAEPGGVKTNVLCGDALHYMPELNTSANARTNPEGNGSLLYMNGDHILLWKPASMKLYRTAARSARFYAGSHSKRRIPLTCPMDAVVLDLTSQEVDLIVLRQTLQDNALTWLHEPRSPPPPPN